MTEAAFKISIEESAEILKEFGLLKMRGVKIINSDGVSDEFKAASQRADYVDCYSTGKRNFDFDFLLSDESFFQFEFKIQEFEKLPAIRYAYFQNPQYYISYNEYLNKLREDGIVESETNDILGETFLEEHEQYTIEAELNASSLSMRYDTDEASYRPCIHSAAHFHIGNGNQVRLPCDKLITPLKFVLFTLKHIYYNHWKELIENKNELVGQRLDESKKLCSSLNDKYWNQIEGRELFLT